MPNLASQDPFVVGGVMVITTRLKREGYTDAVEALDIAIEREWVTVTDDGVKVTKGTGSGVIAEEILENPKITRFLRYEVNDPEEVDPIATLEAIGVAVLAEHERVMAARANGGRWRA